MNDFWASKTGAPITGNPDEAFTRDFSVIPDGTTAMASIKEFTLVEKEFNGIPTRFYQITWKISSGDFKGREVTQKIKCFDQKPEISQRALNMMKLIYNLCAHKPSHNDVPQDSDHRPLIGKTLGIKIGEWQMPKKDGSGIMEGNMVTEVHNAVGFKSETGVKREITKAYGSSGDMGFGHMPPAPGLDDVPW